MGRISVLRLPEGPTLHSPTCTRFKQCFGRGRRAPWMQVHPKQRPIASCQSPDGINVVAGRRELRNASSSPASAYAPPAPWGVGGDKAVLRQGPHAGAGRQPLEPHLHRGSSITPGPQGPRRGARQSPRATLGRQGADPAVKHPRASTGAAMSPLPPYTSLLHLVFSLPESGSSQCHHSYLPNALDTKLTTKTNKQTAFLSQSEYMKLYLGLQI